MRVRGTTDGGQLLPARLVAPLAAAAGACLLAATLLGGYARGRRSTPLDLRVDAALQPLADAAAAPLDLVVRLVEPGRVLWLCVGLGLVAALGRHPAAALLCGAGPGVALGLTWAGKQLVGRQSATLSDEFDAYPSGHAAGVFALAALVFVLTVQDGVLRDRLRPRAVRLLRWGSAVLAAATALALTALRHHYVTDVLGGAALTVGAVLAVAVLQQLLGARGDPGLPGPPPAGRARPPSCSPAPGRDRR